MGIEEMVEIERQADDFMKKPPEQREKLLYIAVLRSDRRMSKLESDGCARQCNTGMMAIVDRWTPAAIGSAFVGILVGVLEYFRGRG